DTVSGFNYEDHLDHPESVQLVMEFFSNLSEGMNHINLPGLVSVHLFNGMFEDVKLGDIRANYILHDAFSPDVNDELWTGKTFKNLYRMIAENVILSTYCAASKARGAMAWAGWKVARAEGALGKREMTLASLNPNCLGGLKRINEKRLARRYEENDF